MMVPEISGALIDWASNAGMSYSIFESDGAACFANAGGEYRYYIRESADSGWYTVTKASRNDPEWLVFSASDLAGVEKYFWASFGADIRTVQGLPRVEFPTESEDIAHGFSVKLSGQGESVLVDGAGKPVIRAGGDDITDIFLLVMMSYCLSASVADLKSSFTDPQGRPIFPIRPERN
jgi:hypothetical protein